MHFKAAAPDTMRNCTHCRSNPACRETKQAETRSRSQKSHWQKLSAAPHPSIHRDSVDCVPFGCILTEGHRTSQWITKTGLQHRALNIIRAPATNFPARRAVPPRKNVCKLGAASSIAAKIAFRMPTPEHSRIVAGECILPHRHAPALRSSPGNLIVYCVPTLRDNAEASAES